MVSGVAMEKASCVYPVSRAPTLAVVVRLQACRYIHDVEYTLYVTIQTYTELISFERIILTYILQAIL
jgi:hypothetical protein